MKYLIGVDVGTSGTKTALFDTKGNMISSHTAEYPLYQPQNGWAEQDPEDWYNATCEGIRQVCQKIDTSEICGIGFSGQMHGIVMLDGENKVLRHSIIWCDQRTSKECEQITEAVGANRLIEVTKSPALSGFTASKIIWVRNNQPDVYEKCKHILLPKDYVRFRLTGEFFMDVSDASGTQLLDIEKRCWSEEILQKLDIDISLLPKICESCDIAGRINKNASDATGLRKGTIVAAGAGDNAAAAIGCGVIRDGQTFTTIGTSGVVYAHTSSPISDTSGRIHSFCGAVRGQWHVMGVTQAAGLSQQWFRNNFCHEENDEASARKTSVYKIMDEKAEKSPIGANRLVYLPYLMGERTPHLDPGARGAFVGLSAIHTKSDMMRSITEGVTYSLMDCLSLFDGIGINTTSMIACGGGAHSAFWRQMLSDVFGIPVSVTESGEGGVLGAALIAGVASGIYKDIYEACENIKIKSTFYPNVNANKEYMKFYDIYKTLYPSLKSIYKSLSKL